MLRLATCAAISFCAPNALAATDTSTTQNVLDHWADRDRTMLTTLAVGFGATGALTVGTGTVMFLASDDDDRGRRNVAAGLIGGGLGFVAGSLLTFAAPPRGAHERLLAQLRAGVPLSEVEARWSESAASARTVRYVVAAIEGTIGVAGFAGATIAAASRDDSWMFGFLVLGIVETMSATFTLMHPRPIEASFHTYRLTQGLAAVRPVFAADQHSARFGIAASF